MHCPFADLLFDRQEAAILCSIKADNQLEVRLLSQPRIIFLLRPVFCTQYSSVLQMPEVLNQLLRKLQPYTLLKLLIRETGTEHLSAQTFLCFNCRVNPAHPAGPVLERVSKRDNYVELSRLMFFSALDELCHREQFTLCREKLIGRNFFLSPRQTAQHMYNLLGKQDMLQSKTFSEIRRRSQHNAASPLKRMQPSIVLAQQHNKCKIAYSSKR